MSTSTNSPTMKTIRDRLQACRDKLPKLQVNIPARPTHMENIAEEPRKPKRKALLIGVQYTTMGENALKGPHKDVAAMKKLLIGVYEFIYVGRIPTDGSNFAQKNTNTAQKTSLFWSTRIIQSKSSLRTTIW